LNVVMKACCRRSDRLLGPAGIYSYHSHTHTHTRCFAQPTIYFRCSAVSPLPPE